MDWIEQREDRKTTFWDSPQEQYDENVEITLLSLRAYAQGKKLAVTYSGGKDSSATLSLIIWAIESGQLQVDDLIILYADTGLELPPLAVTAEATLSELDARGYKTKIVKAPVESRLYVKMLGFGYPYPTNRRRWCTRLLKQEPMSKAISELDGEWTLITGVRLNESDQRDAVITASCSTGDGECGQGWYQQNKNALAPIVHWRACHVFRWIFNDERNSLPVLKGIEPVYKLDEFVDNGIRTGCIKCQVVHKDRSFNALVKHSPEWQWLAPLHELDVLHKWLAQPAQRLQKATLTLKADGTYRNRITNPIGPVHIEARQKGLEWIMKIQDETNKGAPDGLSISLVSLEEEMMIRDMWANNIYPSDWTGDEPHGDEIVDVPIVINGIHVATQKTLPNIGTVTIDIFEAQHESAD